MENFDGFKKGQIVEFISLDFCVARIGCILLIDIDDIIYIEYLDQEYSYFIENIQLKIMREPISPREMLTQLLKI